jgi:NhaP-type Na+/H+ or K+/H+ antiporter
VDTTAVLVITATIFLWGTVSARLSGADLTAPIVFVAVGALVSATDLVDVSLGPQTLKPLAEVTLVCVLFSDAARIPLRELRTDAGRYARLLGLGLPLTVLGGWALAQWLLPGLGGWLALLVLVPLVGFLLPWVTGSAVCHLVLRSRGESAPSIQTGAGLPAAGPQPNR